MQNLGPQAARSAHRLWAPLPYLCPALYGGIRATRPARLGQIWCRRRLHLAAREPTSADLSRIVPIPPRTELPLTCPGCGAYTQSLEPNDAGFYTLSRNTVKSYINARDDPQSEARKQEDEVYKAALESVDSKLVDELQLGGTNAEALAPRKTKVPVCDRCHHLIHHHQGVSVAHPTLEAIQQTISESPHKHNHVYHIIDAADFPMSLIPKLPKYLSLSPQRSRNRRSSASKYHHGQKAEISFIITRSDLFAPTKEQVDKLMPYLIEVLRDALGSAGKDVRLGNVRCVSSKRGWWTTKIKEEIWERGGGGWMVGKVNVGKSNLCQSVFPKGRTEGEVDFQAIRQRVGARDTQQTAIDSSTSEVSPLELPESLETPLVERQPGDSQVPKEAEDLSDFSMLPPPQQETTYPEMPTISYLPGTTASPIRLPFGNGKGELIDLPGLARGDLELQVRVEHRLSLVMQNRSKPPQISIKPGQSFMLADLIRITPNFPPDTIFLAAPFFPLKCHITNTEKAAAVQRHEDSIPDLSITTSEAATTIASAGVFELKWDVTKARTGPLTAKDAAGIKPKQLPFVIYGADVLVEGCGWVEIAVQVRKKVLEQSGASLSGSGDFRPNSELFPTVEIFSPNGKHIGVRKPMNAWILGGHQRKPKSQRTTRPRRSMKGMKKAAKRLARENAASAE